MGLTAKQTKKYWLWIQIQDRTFTEHIIMLLSNNNSIPTKKKKSLEIQMSKLLIRFKLFQKIEWIKKCERFFNAIYKLHCKTVPFKNSQLLLCQGSTPNKDSLDFPENVGFLLLLIFPSMISSSITSFL